MARSNLVRVQEKGQVTLPVAVREQLGIKRGDLVSVSATADGVLIVPQRACQHALRDEISDALAEQRLTLDELIDSGREIRGELLREMYGIEPAGSG